MPEIVASTGLLTLSPPLMIVASDRYSGRSVPVGEAVDDAESPSAAAVDEDVDEADDEAEGEADAELAVVEGTGTVMSGLAVWVTSTRTVDPLGALSRPMVKPTISATTAGITSTASRRPLRLRGVAWSGLGIRSSGSGYMRVLNLPGSTPAEVRAPLSGPAIRRTAAEPDGARAAGERRRTVNEALPVS